LFARDTSEWINRVNQKHKQLIDLGLSDEQKERLDRFCEIEFVYSTLKIEGAGVTREDVTRISSSAGTPDAESDHSANALSLSLRVVSALARKHGKGAELTPELLLKLHSVPGAGLRTSGGDTSRLSKPMAPEHLPALLESACQWYTAESFTELNPVEQASIVLLRLIDLQPFEQANERTALVAASLFTMRSHLPPIIIKPELASAYRNALDEGARMNTKPMVETIAEAVEKSLEELIEESR
jgi:Fic family protein